MSVNCFHASSKCSLHWIHRIIFKTVFIAFRMASGSRKYIKLHIENMWAKLRKILEAATGGVL